MSIVFAVERVVELGVVLRFPLFKLGVCIWGWFGRLTRLKHGVYNRGEPRRGLYGAEINVGCT